LSNAQILKQFLGWADATKNLQFTHNSLHVKEFLENVLSRDEMDRQAYDMWTGVRALGICSRDMAWCKRPRLYWMQWGVKEGEGVAIKEAKGFT
jgi:hypothetical protein